MYLLSGLFSGDGLLRYLTGSAEEVKEVREGGEWQWRSEGSERGEEQILRLDEL